MVGRSIARESMAWNRISHFETLIQIESDYKDPDSLVSPASKGKFIEWVDSLEGHLREMRGVRKVPLSYIIRDGVDCQHMRQHIHNHMEPSITPSRKR